MNKTRRTVLKATAAVGAASAVGVLAHHLSERNTVSPSPVHKAPPDRSAFDYIIVGGGSAGCVLANRLSSAPDIKVLLIEAGTDWTPGAEPASVRDTFPTSLGVPDFFWPTLTAEFSAPIDDKGTRITGPYQQARVMGGGSSINGMTALRGLPGDYDEWSALGAEGWDWAGVLPYFKLAEADQDFGGPLHGKSGPIPIRRHFLEEWPAFSQAFARSAEARGFKYLADLNEASTDGFGPLPNNSTPTHRVSASIGYLGAEVRRRSNLTILSSSTVQSLLTRGRQVFGVTATTPSGVREYHARETILSAGALHSPAILMRAGIGPRAHLKNCGVEVIADLRGVGQNLANHPSVFIAALKRHESSEALARRVACYAGLRYSSGRQDCAAGDMMLAVFNKSAWHPLGDRVGGLFVSPFKSYSRGSVSLRDRDPNVEPLVKFELLSDSRDFERLIDGTKLCCELLASADMQAAIDDAFLPDFAVAGSLSEPNRQNWLKSYGIAKGLQLPAPIRRKLLGRGRLDVSKVAADREALERIVASNAFPQGHVAGTCRMGAVGDEQAVLDSQCRVHGVGGVRVVDASIMPSIISANTNLPVIMLAEKAAALIAES